MSCQQMLAFLLPFIKDRNNDLTVSGCDSLKRPIILQKWTSVPYEAAFALNYYFPHDFAGKDVLNILGGVLSK